MNPKLFWLLIGIILFLIIFILTEPLERIDRIKINFFRKRR